MTNGVIVIHNDENENEVAGVILASQIIGITENEDREGVIDIHLLTGKTVSMYVGADENGSASDMILSLMSDMGWA